MPSQFLTRPLSSTKTCKRQLCKWDYAAMLLENWLKGPGTSMESISLLSAGSDQEQVFVVCSWHMKYLNFPRQNQSLDQSSDVRHPFLQSGVNSGCQSCCTLKGMMTWPPSFLPSDMVVMVDRCLLLDDCGLWSLRACSPNWGQGQIFASVCTVDCFMDLVNLPVVKCCFCMNLLVIVGFISLSQQRIRTFPSFPVSLFFVKWPTLDVHLSWLF